MNTPETQQSNNRPKIEWVPAKDFEVSGFRVRIQMSKGFRPRYSLSVGRVNQDGKFVPFLPIFVEGQGKVKIKRISTIISELLAASEDWIHNECQIREDQIIEEKQAREADPHAVVHKHTGKTEKNRLKHKAKQQ